MPSRLPNAHHCRTFTFGNAGCSLPIETVGRLIGHLANDGNYREMRFFTPFSRAREIEDYYLESVASQITGQRKVPFGDALISTEDTAFG